MKIQLHTRKSLATAIRVALYQYAHDVQLAILAGVDMDDIPDNIAYNAGLIEAQALADQLPPYDPCTAQPCAGSFEVLTRLEDGVADAKQCDECGLLVGLDH